MARFTRFQLLITVMVLLSSIVYSQSTTTYDFLRNDVGARAAAMGGTFVTMMDDPNAIFYNPAGLASLSQQRFSFGFFKHLMDINSGYASFGKEIPNLGFIGVGVVYVNYGEFHRTGEEGQDLGTFGAGDFALTASYASSLQPDLHYGVSAKFIYSSIAEIRSSAAAIDFGIQYIAVPDRMTIGMSVMNLGAQLVPYLTTRENLPVDMNIGVALFPEHLPAVITLGVHKLTDKYDGFSERLKAFAIGFEFTPGPNVHVRAGYNNEKRQELKILSSSGLAGFSIGGGITTEMYGIDYAFTSYGQIGAVHRISVTF